MIKHEGTDNPGRRVDLLELFSIKMRQISERPEWGSLEFLSIQGVDYTAVVEFPAGVGAFGMVRRRHVPSVQLRGAVADAMASIPTRNGVLV